MSLRRKPSRILWIYIFLPCFLCALLLSIPQPAQAAEFSGDQTIIIGADEIIDDDLFVSGESVTIDGTVTGNLFAGGADVTINGTVNGSVVTSGRTLVVNGTIDGSLYSGGYSLALGPEASVGRNLFFGGFNLALEEGSEIERSLYVGGYQLILDGAVADDVNVGVGALELNGSVGRDVVGTVGGTTTDEAAPDAFMPSFEGQVPAVRPGLRMGESAQVGGDISVDMESMEVAESAPAPLYSLANQRTRTILGELIGLLLVGALLLWWRPDWLRRTVEVVQESPLPSMGVGILAVVAVFFLLPVAVALIVLVAVVGVLISLGQLVGPILGIGFGGLALAATLFFFVTSVVSRSIVALSGGRFVTRRASEDAIAAADFVPLIIGLVIYGVLRAVPFGVGLIVASLVSSIGVGAIFLSWRRGDRLADGVSEDRASDEAMVSVPADL